MNKIPATKGIFQQFLLQQTTGNLHLHDRLQLCPISRLENLLSTVHSLFCITCLSISLQRRDNKATGFQPCCRNEPQTSRFWRPAPENSQPANTRHTPDQAVFHCRNLTSLVIFKGKLTFKKKEEKERAVHSLRLLVKWNQSSSNTGDRTQDKNYINLQILNTR